MANSSMDVYLNDHFAGATAGTNLARLAADEHRSDEHGPFFLALAAEIAADYETLGRLLDDLAVDRSATKTALAEIGSKLARPKFTGDAADDPELGTFVTLETLSIGVEGKACMWRALRTLHDGDYPTLDDVDLDALLARAEDQRARIEAKRLELAPRGLAHTVSV